MCWPCPLAGAEAKRAPNERPDAPPRRDRARIIAQGAGDLGMGGIPRTTRAAGAGGVTRAERRAKLRFMDASLAAGGKGQLERKELFPQTEGDDPADRPPGPPGHLPERQRAVACLDASEGGCGTSKGSEGDEIE